MDEEKLKNSCICSNFSSGDYSNRGGYMDTGLQEESASREVMNKAIVKTGEIKRDLDTQPTAL